MNNQDSIHEEQNAEQENRNVSEAQQDFAKKMQAIASDLWGTLNGNPANRSLTGMEKQAEATGKPEVKPERKERGADSPAKAIEDSTDQAEKKQLMLRKGLHSLWKTADATVEWTDAFVHDSPSDGLCSQRRWDFYRRLAPRVLEGDLEAYVEVLTSTNPLGDLTDYVNGMVIRTPNADRLECRFESRSDLLEKEGKLYLCALAVRIARDLLAALPVGEVYVEGNLDGNRRIGVVIPRSQLSKRNPVFLEPIGFVEACSGMVGA